jgi:hypothetical protein
MQQHTLRSVLGATVAIAAIASFTYVFSNTRSAVAAEADPHVSVRCEPTQRAVILQPERSVGPTMVECVTAAARVHAPAAATLAAPVVRTAPVLRTAPVRTVARSSESTWKKRALIIGGAAGAGAGVGAIAGGKKGALIGAAIGGGSATLIDVLKRR